MATAGNSSARLGTLGTLRAVVGGAAFGAAASSLMALCVASALGLLAGGSNTPSVGSIMGIYAVFGGFAGALLGNIMAGLAVGAGITLADVRAAGIFKLLAFANFFCCFIKDGHHFWQV